GATGWTRCCRTGSMCWGRWTTRTTCWSNARPDPVAAHTSLQGDDPARHFPARHASGLSVVIMTQESGRRGRGGWWRGAALLAAIGLLSGCAATSVLTFAYEQANEGECLSAGCAGAAVLKHVLDKATEGD